jgi:hypothetical protein
MDDLFNELVAIILERLVLLWELAVAVYASV